MENNTNNKKEKTVYMDYAIFQGKVRLIKEDGTSSILERDDAIDIAKSQGLNLVQVGYNKNEKVKPICKLINYGKYKYEMQKKEKDAKRKAKIANAEAKEVYFSIRIDDGDLKTKITHIRNFLVEDKVKVKVCVKLLRREMNLLGMAKELMLKILGNLEDIAELDVNPSFNSGIMSCTIRPKK